MNVTITRRTKLGYDYNCDASHYDTIGIPYPDKPYHVGTYNKVMDAIIHDRTRASIVSGGTYFSEAWFVKINGKWHRIIEPLWGWIVNELADRPIVKVEVEP